MFWIMCAINISFYNQFLELLYTLPPSEEDRASWQIERCVHIRASVCEHLGILAGMLAPE